MSLITLWILYSLLCIGLFTVLFLWAIRAGQFRDQERARRLALLYPPERDPRE
jgi:cbb3-type cytochrome oxidase maturation protein